MAKQDEVNRNAAFFAKCQNRRCGYASPFTDQNTAISLAAQHDSREHPTTVRRVTTFPRSAYLKTISTGAFLLERISRLLPYTKQDIREFNIPCTIIAYASPDSTYFVTHKLISAAQKSIVMGLYDFKSEHMKELIIEALGKGVKVTLKLQNGGDIEGKLFDELRAKGAKCEDAPSEMPNKYFECSHDKIIVIDDEWTMIQSANYNNSSIPENRLDGVRDANFKTGNREMGVAIKSEALAAVYRGMIRRDMELEPPADKAAVREIFEGFELPVSEEILIEKPQLLPDVFPSKKFEFQTVKLQPVFTPDNYMDHVPGLLRSATKSIKLQQQYIKVDDDAVVELLDAIKSARQRNEDISIQIILAAPFAPSDDQYEEAQALMDMGFDVRFQSRRHFDHCHNKMVMIDDEKVVICSQNWSRPALRLNRESGIIIHDAGVSEYFARIFATDWEISEDITRKPSRVTETLEVSALIEKDLSDFKVVDIGDIREV